MSAEPEPAFLALPDGEAARRSTAGGGIAFASLKQRRISAGGSSPSSTPLARTQGAAGSMGSGYFAGTISRFGSTVAGFVSSSGGTAPPAEPGKDQ